MKTKLHWFHVHAYNVFHEAVVSLFRILNRWYLPLEGVNRQKAMISRILCRPMEAQQTAPSSYLPVSRGCLALQWPPCHWEEQSGLLSASCGTPQRPARLGHQSRLYPCCAQLTGYESSPCSLSACKNVQM